MNLEELSLGLVQKAAQTPETEDDILALLLFTLIKRGLTKSVPSESNQVPFSRNQGIKNPLRIVTQTRDRNPLP